MNKILKITTFFIFTFILSAFTHKIINWNIDSNYAIKFSGGKAEGTFSGLKGTIVYDAQNLGQSKIDVSVEVTSIKTGNLKMDKHAIGENWFDAAKYPTIKFTSSSFTNEADKIIVTGILDLHGVKKQVQIPFTFTNNNNKGTFVGDFKISRKDYGIKGNMFGFVVGNQFSISLQVPVSK
jgi:polyisoprenoid-binding protein YceI